MGDVDERPNAGGRTGRELLPRIPGRLLWGLVIGVAAWFVSMRTGRVSSVDGVVVECATLDWAKILLGALVVALAVDGARHARARRRSLSWPASAVLAALLVVDGTVLVLTGFDVVLRACG